MAENPSYKGTDVKLSGDNPVNDPKPYVRRTTNKFKNSYPHVTTCRYGDCTPFFVTNGVENDVHALSSRHEVRADTMVSPFLGDLIMKKAYFDVPLRAIYPLNYDLMRVPPVSGDDVPVENTAYIPGSFFFSLNNCLNNFTIDNLNSSNGAYETIRFIFFLEKLFSRASLFDRLGFHMSNMFRYLPRGIDVEFIDRTDSFDLFFESFCNHYFNGEDHKILFYKNGVTYIPAGTAMWTGWNNANYTEVSLHWILEQIRDNPFDCSYDIVFSDGSPFFMTDAPAEIETIIRNINLSFDTGTDINIERLIAYQLSCVEYMTDDHIDSIYSTDLYRNMMRYWFDNSLVSDSLSKTFERNGLSMPYDVFSSIFWQSFVQMNNFEPLYFFYGDDSWLKYFWNIVSIRKSLRFEDYFVGGRLHPLAVGDVDVPVTGDSVSAYEVAKAQVYTRFFNSVNLSGPEFDTYSKEIVGNTPPPRSDVPKFLAMTMSPIRGYEVENTTSDNQGALVTNIRSEGERFAFNVELDHDSILIGFCFFEARRLYSKTADRHFYHIDRFDRFIPNLQKLGDQDISQAELRVGKVLDRPFAYGVRNGEYKQRVGIVSGGLVDFLKSWTMVTDVVDSYDDNDNLDSDYIRSKCVEFDRFFITSNNSDAGWFHFIVKFDNDTEPLRPMEVAPEILL